ncbi:hypothetical protein Q7P37_005188 [Cladosporium fusiforme]
MSKKNLLVCFDAFGTLFTPRKPVAQQYGEVARSFGLGGFNDDDIAKSFKAAFKHESKQNPNYGKATGLGAEKWWSNIINGTFKPYLQPGHSTPTNLVPTLIHRFHSKEGYALYPDVLPLLKQLRNIHKPEDGSVVIGVITNSDNRTADILTSMGVRVNPLHFGDKLRRSDFDPEKFDIDFTVLSYDVGYEKPDSIMFGAAETMAVSLLEDQKPDPESWRKVYVGDEFDKDVVGASNAGWHAVLIDRETAGKRTDIEWLDDQQPGSLFDVFDKVKAVGFSSLSKLAACLPSRS